MRDPYEVVGIARGATIQELNAAFRRESKKRHPDYGGSNEAMAELNIACAFLRAEFARRDSEQPKDQTQPQQDREREEKRRQQAYRDFDEELQEMQRAAQARAQANAASEQAPETNDGSEIATSFRRFTRTGLKGLAGFFAALVAAGSFIFVEMNFVSVLILLGSTLGFVVSLALKSDKGGIMSAALLLFGVMTLWLPPVRNALFMFPLATVSILILLALIFKFAQAGGMVGLLTGGALALYVIAAIVGDTSTAPENVAVIPQAVRTTPPPPANTPPAPASQTPTKPVPPPPPEPRTLLASDGAILKFVSGVPYHLKVRNGRATSLRATQGTVKLISGEDGNGTCFDSLDFPLQSGNGPWREIDRILRACGDDAVMSVHTAP